MIPFTQTKVVVKNSKDEMVVRGNCFAAAVACLTEIPITDVPNVETLFHIEGDLWLDVMIKWLNSLGFEFMYDAGFMVFHENNFNDDEREKAMLRCRDKFYIATGKGPRGVNHNVIMKNGIMIHDPHPSRDGLISVSYCETIEKIEPPKETK